MIGRRLEAVPPRPDDPHMWKRLQNLLYRAGEDALFEWLRGVRETVERAERAKRRGRAA